MTDAADRSMTAAIQEVIAVLMKAEVARLEEQMHEAVALQEYGKIDRLTIVSMTDGSPADIVGWPGSIWDEEWLT